MKIKRVEIVGNYKRFDNLVIGEIPETARLVVLIGPNGSGKSSLFDAFLLKSQAYRSNYDLNVDDGRREYYIKQADREFPTYTQTLAENIKIEFHNAAPSGDEWAALPSTSEPPIESKPTSSFPAWKRSVDLGNEPVLPG